MISEAHARKAMQAQIDSLKADFKSARNSAQKCGNRRLQLSHPLPRLNEAQAEKKK